MEKQNYNVIHVDLLNKVFQLDFSSFPFYRKEYFRPSWNGPRISSSIDIVQKINAIIGIKTFNYLTVKPRIKFVIK